MNTLNMRQISKNRWTLESLEGKIILEDILLYSVEEARQFAKAYVSSWQSWDFNVIPLERLWTGK